MRIKQLKLSGSDFFGSVTIDLSHESDSKNFTTIIIGPNGAGKSILLGNIADIMSIELSADKSKALRDFDKKYELTLNQQLEDITVTQKTPKGSLEVGRILAVTNTLNDRFPFIAKNSVKKSEEYVYLGLKTTSNNIFISNVKEKVLTLLFNIIEDEKKVEAAKAVLEELGFRDSFSFTVKKAKNYAKSLKFLGGDREVNFNNNYDSSKLQRYLKGKSKSKRKTLELLSTLRRVGEKGVYKGDVTLGRRSPIHNESIRFEILQELLEQNIISVSDLSLHSFKQHDIEKASSGEFNILRTLLAIVANVRDNSIILIDEPEISLHPNWQINFVPILDIALSKYTGCHAIIATHSHFMLTNLKPDSSTIVSVNRSNNGSEIIVKELSIEPYGWSPENILYQAFGLTGNRNKYFEHDLRLIASYLSQSKGKPQSDTFVEAVTRIEKYPLSKADPLSDILEQAKCVKNKLLG